MSRMSKTTTMYTFPSMAPRPCISNTGKANMMARKARNPPLTNLGGAGVTPSSVFLICILIILS